MTKICVVGLWHLGCVTSACLANFGYKVIGYDENKELIKNLNENKPPIFEPELENLIKKNLKNKNLTFTNNSASIEKADYVILTIDTPVDENDKVDLTSVYDAVNLISEKIISGCTIIIQSQVPVGTCDTFIKNIKQKRPKLNFNLSYCPENLRLGKSIELFTNPDRIIIGADDEETKKKVLFLFNVINCPKITMSIKSAEMTKHAINAFLATCISFINWIGNLSEEVGANAKEISDGLMSEKRIGNNLPLKAGSGFAGGTLGRDLRILEELGLQYHLEPYLVNAVQKINHEQNTIAIRKLLKNLNNLNNLKICVLGLTYKPHTNTLRRSLALEVIHELLELNARVSAYDPAISSIDSISNANFEICSSVYDATKDANGILLFTDWPEFQDIDYDLIFSVMKTPLIIDMKNFLDSDILKKIGFTYVGIG